MQDVYARALAVVADHTLLVLLVLLATIALNVWLFVIIPKGFFPHQDTGRLIGRLQGDQSISFQLMSKKLTQMMAIVQHDKAVDSMLSATPVRAAAAASAQTNTGQIYVSLKSESKRDSMDVVMARLRRALGSVPVAGCSCSPCRISASAAVPAMRNTNIRSSATARRRSTNGRPKLLAVMEKDPTFIDVSSDQQQKAWRPNVVVDRDDRLTPGPDDVSDRQHPL